MAAPATQNPQVKSESKSAKKKKAKVATTDAEPAAAPAAEQATNGPTESSSGDGSYESPYIKELYKNIRNINKKIANASKVDGIVAENADKTLDQLVAERKINADQKAQILKKPGLAQQLQQYEEQIAHFKKFDQEYKAASQAEKAAFEKTHTDRASKELEEAVSSAKAEGASAAREAQESNLLLLSQFLRLAAIRRGEDEDPELEENKALEGLLGRVYTGDAAAVSSMLSLINGSDEKIYSVNGDPLSVSFADIKRIALAQAAPSTLESAADPSEEEPTAVTDYPVQSDPTIANAGLTEIDEPSATAAPVNGTSTANEIEGIPQNSGFGGEGNAAAKENWDAQNDLSTSQEWVEVPRDAAETDTGVTATPAAATNTQSWADDQPESPTQTTAAPPATEDDGFQNVPQRSRGRGDRGQGGQYRGNRGRGEYRGRGRGDGRGRGGRGGPRGGPRRGGEES